MSIQTIINILSKGERPYAASFKLNNEIKRTLKDWDCAANKVVEINIIKSITFIDIYTLPRIVKEFEF